MHTVMWSRKLELGFTDLWPSLTSTNKHLAKQSAAQGNTHDAIQEEIPPPIGNWYRSPLDIMLQSGWQGRVVSGSMPFCQGVVRRPYDHSGTWVKVCLFLIWHIIHDWSWTYRFLEFMWLLTYLSNKEWLNEVHMYVHFQSWTCVLAIVKGMAREHTSSTNIVPLWT